MIIYIDSDCKCHAENGEGLRAFDVPFFDGKCKVLIEGFRYVPHDETWTRADGEEFEGEMISLVEDLSIFAAQAQYEIDLTEIELVKTELADADLALAELGAEI